MKGNPEEIEELEQIRREYWAKKYRFPYEIAHKLKEKAEVQFWNGRGWTSEAGFSNFLPVDAVRTGDPELASVLLKLIRAFGRDLLVSVKPNQSQPEQRFDSSSIQSSNSERIIPGKLKESSSTILSAKKGGISWSNIFSEPKDTASPDGTSKEDT